MDDRRTVIIASGNEGKIREFRQMLEPQGMIVRSLKDLNGFEEPEETGNTFHDNAIIKAQAVTDRYGIMAVSDDSGLEIDALDKKPGVYSARWLGHDTPYEVKNQKVLELMKDKKDRTCRYVCAIAVTRPGKEPVVFEESVECEIADRQAGSNGFGYDPIIYYPPFHKTMAEMTENEKNSISHRGKAIRRLEAWLNEENN